MARPRCSRNEPKKIVVDRGQDSTRIDNDPAAWLEAEEVCAQAKRPRKEMRGACHAGSRGLLREPAAVRCEHRNLSSEGENEIGMGRCRWGTGAGELRRNGGGRGRRDATGRHSKRLLTSPPPNAAARGPQRLEVVAISRGPISGEDGLTVTL